jgi:hypothetical protein
MISTSRNRQDHFAVRFDRFVKDSIKVLVILSAAHPLFGTSFFLRVKDLF